MINKLVIIKKVIFNKQSISAWIYLIINGIGGAIISMLAARYLSSEISGVWFSLQSLVSVLLLSDMGIQLVTKRQIAHSFSSVASPNSGDTKLLRGMFVTRTGLAGVSDVLSVVSYIRRYTIILCIVLSVAIYFLFINNFEFSEKINIYNMIGSWILMTIGAIFQIIAYKHQAAIEGIGRIEIERILSTLAQLVTIIGMALAIIIYKNLILMSGAWAFGSLINIIIQKKGFDVFLNKIPIPRVDVGNKSIEMLKISIPIWLVMIGSVATKSIQAPMIMLLIGSSQVTSFYLVQKLLGVLTTGISILITSNCTIFTQKISSEEYSLALKIYKQGMLSVLILSVIAGLVFGIMGKYIIKIWIDGEDLISNITIFIMTVDFILLTFTSGFGSYILASGRNPFMLSVFSSGLLNIGLLYLLLPKIGILGAAISSFIAGILTSYWFNIYYGYKVYKILKSGV